MRIERARPGEGERLALGFEGPLVSCQQRVRSGNRRVQLHHIATLGLLPDPNVFAGKLDIEIFLRQLDLEGGHRRAGDDIIDHAAAVGDSFAYGKQVKRIRLHRLRQSLDAHRCLPDRITQPKRGLDAADFAREKGRRDLG